MLTRLWVKSRNTRLKFICKAGSIAMMNADSLTSRACRAASTSSLLRSQIVSKAPAAPFHSICQVKEPLSLLRILPRSCLSYFRLSRRPVASVSKMSNLFSGMWVLTSPMFHLVVSRRSRYNSAVLCLVGVSCERELTPAVCRSISLIVSRISS